MKILRIFFYIIKQAVRNICKNGFMIFASICVIFVSLFVLGSLQLASANLQDMLDDMSDRPEIQLDCYTEITDAVSLSIRDKVAADPRVESIVRISKQENLDRFYEYFPDSEDLFEGYVENPDFLYVSFEVKLKDSGTGTAFVDDMKRMEGIERVVSTLDVLEVFARLKVWIQVGTIASLVIMGVLSVLLTANTIKLTAMARKNELEIMKYVGASESFIRGPFVIEGVFIGGLGALLSFFAVRAAYNFLAGYVNRQASLQSLIHLGPFHDAGAHFLLYYCLAGILVGALASAVTIKKYIKV